MPARGTVRPLIDSIDRLALVCGAETPKTIQGDLRRVLDRLRGLNSAEAISRSAQSHKETNALEIVLAQTRSAWESLAGAVASDDQVRSLLRLVWVVRLDCESGGADEQSAKQLLRESVLIKPQDDASCWAVLVSTCSDLATLRNGLSLHQIQAKLTAASIPIRSARSYREDILRLQETTRASLQDLGYLSDLLVGANRVKIAREHVGSLSARAAVQSILLTGEPGSGKSGAMHDLAEELMSRSNDVLYLSADRLDAGSLNSLRLELGISHDLSETLENWQGIGPAFLLIDALDAARADPASRTLRDLIRRVVRLKRWRVVASIRKFDLRYSPELQDLFRGPPAVDSADPEFPRVSHVLIKQLSNLELGQAASQSPELAACLPLVPVELIRLVFNLKILGELVGAGIEIGEANAIQTQLELLELYWKYRVLDRPTRDASEEVLRSAARAMLKHKALRADRSDVAQASAELNDLLSRGVLIEWQAKSGTDRNKLAFSHHVIFDFAVSTLLFRGDDDTLFRALLEDTQLVLIARPSIVFHYHHVWSQDADELKRFWTLVFTLQGAALPSIGKLIGPSVAVERAMSVRQFSLLIHNLSETGQLRDSSERILNYVAGSLLSDDRPLFGRGAGPWCEFAKEISLSLTPSAAYDLRALLMRMLDKPELLTDEQLGYSGVASRNLLEFAWSQPKRDRYLVIAGLDNVCKTYRSAPASSSELLRRALEPEHVAQFGFEELPWIARQLATVLPVDPALVGAVYVAAFGYVESSTEAVPIGSSRLLPLTSTRKQDFEGARWELGRFFSKFISFDPIRATSALIRCVDSYVTNDRRTSRLAPATSEEKEFKLLGMNAKIALDYSSIWDRDVVGHKGTSKNLLLLYLSFLAGR